MVGGGGSAPFKEVVRESGSSERSESNVKPLQHLKSA